MFPDEIKVYRLDQDPGERLTGLVNKPRSARGVMTATPLQLFACVCVCFHCVCVRVCVSDVVYVIGAV